MFYIQTNKSCNMKHKGVSFLLDYPGEVVLSNSNSREDGEERE